MVAKPTSANPCCVALRLKYSKLDDKRNALRKCSTMLRDQVDRLEADNRGLKNAYDEERARVGHERDLKEKEMTLRISLESKVVELESQLSSLLQAGCPRKNLDMELMILQEQYDEVRARVDHERDLKEKETVLRISLESKVAELESQLYSLQQAGCPLSQNMDNELLIVQAKYDEERARVDHERDLKEKETALRISLESKVTELESQLSSLQQAGCSLSQNLEKEWMIVQEQVSEREGIIDGLKQPLDEETRQDNVEKETDKMDRQKALELNEAEKNRAHATLPFNHAEAKMIDDPESNKAILLQYIELADELDKKFTEERSYANNLLKQLEEETLKVELLRKEVQELTSFRESVESDLNQLRSLLEVEKSRVDAEQNKTAKLQMTLELVKKKSLESSNLAQAELKKAKKSLVMMERLKSKASKLTLEQSKYEGMTKKYEAEKQKVLRERQRADTEVAKALELKKLVEENEKRVMEEKSNSMRLLQQIEEERQRVGTLQKQVHELLPSGKHTVERLKLEKKRLKHAKEATKLEKGRNYVLQRELGKLKQGFVQTVQHLDVLEKTLCGGTKAVGESTMMEDTRSLLPDKVAAKHDGSHKKRKVSRKSEGTFEHSHKLAKQSKRDRLLAPAIFPPTQDGGSAPAHKKRKVSRKCKGTLEDSHDLAKQTKSLKLLAPAILLPTKDGGSAQACVDHFTDVNALVGFERQIGGNVMKLLELDNELDELLFQAAVENPLSPNLPEVNCEDRSLMDIDPSDCGVDDTNHKILLTGKDLLFGGFDLETSSIKPKTYDRESCSIDLGIYNHIDSERNRECNVSIGSEQAGGGAKVLSAPVSSSHHTKQTDTNELGLTVENIPLPCILFSYMKDISRISRILFAIRRCLRLCHLHSQTDRRLMELLTALAVEEQLTPREKVCVFFSLTMHELLQLSSNKLEGYNDQCSPFSFPVHLCSVLSDVKNRGILAEAFYFSELLCLFEDFVTQRRLFLCGDQDIGLINDFGSRFDILLEGKKVVLYGKTASNLEVVAGSVIFSSICLAVGQRSTLYDVSFNILSMWPADPQPILYILHGFASVFGGEYFPKSNYSIQLEVVKSMMTVLEKSREVEGATLCQPDSKTCHLYPACSRCPFVGSLPPFDILSVLVKELWKYASMPMDVLDSYINIMASVELISTIMGWSWTTECVLPELQKLLQSSIQGSFYTSLVLLLGRIGRLGVKSCGYEDAGVRRIKQHLSSLLQQISTSEHNHVVASALVFTLNRISLHKEGAQNKLDCPTAPSASSTFATKSYSLLSSEQKGLISALKIS